MGDVVAQGGDVLAAVRTLFYAAPQDDEGDDALAGDVIGRADDSRLGDGRVRYECRLDLGGRDPVSGDVHDIVDATQEPQGPVEVDLGAVTGEVVLRPPRPVGVDVALVVAPDTAQHRGPGLGEHEVTAVAGFNRGAVVVDDRCADAG